MKKRGESGQILVIVLLALVILAILVPAIVSYVRNEASWTNRERKSTLAFHLAEAGIDRGIWKVKESTTTFGQATTGVVIANYNFDKSFSDIDGGFYRIKLSSGPGTREVTITAEGKDKTGKHVRAIKCVVKNQSIPGAVISGGVISYQQDFEAHWGPIMSQSNINIGGNAAKQYFPRKFSKQVVTGTGGYPRDTNGLVPPNTDGKEWWSDYAVPDLPVLDFAAMKADAIKTNTYNVYGCNRGSGWSKVTNAPWSPNNCNSNMPVPADHSIHLLNTDRHPLSKKGYTWYWDNNVALTGSTGSDGNGMIGNVIVKGNLYIDVGDNYAFTGPIPTDAWKEYTKISQTKGDTAAKNEYPGDDGLHKNRTTFSFGGETWNNTPLATGSYPPPAGNTDVGIKGFVYVGGNLILNGIMDICGAVWVKGSVTRLNGSGSEPMLIFFDDSLVIPTLNVVLIRKSWQETKPSSVSWP
jgi:hypothetical protein